MDEDEYEDEYEGYLYVEAKKLTPYALVHVFLCFVIGCLRSAIESLSLLGNEIQGHEIYSENKKAFEDEARLQIEAIADGEDG